MPAIINISPSWPSISVKKLFSGELVEDREIVTVKPIMWSTTDASCHRVMLDLNRAIFENPGTIESPTRVVGYSIWSQVVYKWLRELGPKAIKDIDPRTIEFFTLGCPEQKFTGTSFLWPHKDPPVYPGTTPRLPWSSTPKEHFGGYGVGSGLPLELPWKVYCVANEYDGWADAPALFPANDALDQRRKFLWFTWRQPWFEPGNLFARLRTMNGPHGIPAYEEGNLFGPEHFVYSDPEIDSDFDTYGEAIYIWRRTSYAPVLTGDARAAWNANYERPVEMP